MRTNQNGGNSGNEGGSMSYQEQVQQAAAALVRGEDANWELARLTHENTGDDGVAMAQWCSDVSQASSRKFGTSAGYRYRTIWQRFGLLERVNRPSWTEADYAIRPGAAPDAVKEGIIERAIFNPEAPAEAKREAFQRLAADPVVREAVSQMGSPEAHATSELMAAAARDIRTRAERSERDDPALRQMDAREALIDLEEALRDSAARIRRVLGRIASEGITDPVGNRALLERSLEGLREMVEAVTTYLRTGKTDLDAFLESVLKGE